MSLFILTIEKVYLQINCLLLWIFFIEKNRIFAEPTCMWIVENHLEGGSEEERMELNIKVLRVLSESTKESFKRQYWLLISIQAYNANVLLLLKKKADWWVKDWQLIVTAHQFKVFVSEWQVQPSSECNNVLTEQPTHSWLSAISESGTSEIIQF